MKLVTAIIQPDKLDKVRLDKDCNDQFRGGGRAGHHPRREEWQR